LATVVEEIAAIDEAVCGNIAELAKNRGLLSQNVLSQARTLVDQVSLLAYTNDKSTDSNWDGLEKAKAEVSKRGNFRFLSKFHALLQISTSHYTVDGDSAERLMLKYYEYLLKIQQYLSAAHGIEIFHNLKDFPLNLDPALTEYHRKIAHQISRDRAAPLGAGRSSNYYIHKIVPIFTEGRILYEVTFTRAVGWTSKFDRLIAFTDLDILENHSVDFELVDTEIEVLNAKMPIRLIRSWSVSVRPCEFDNLAKLFGVTMRARRGNRDYRALMAYMTERQLSLLDVIDLSDSEFDTVVQGLTEPGSASRIRDLIVQIRSYCRRDAVGTNVIRYLLLRARNETIRQQTVGWGETGLGDTQLTRRSYPFDRMPFYASLAEHNPRLADVFASIKHSNRLHELLARRIRANVEQRGELYTPLTSLEGFSDVETLVKRYNALLPSVHPGRKLIIDKGHVFIRSYEEDTVEIFRMLRELTSSGLAGYTDAVDNWLDGGSYTIDDETKRVAIRALFDQSKVALIYGAAGTGKSTMIKHISEYFSGHRKLYLAKTHAAVENLRARVTAADDIDFRTISSHLGQRGGACSVLFIDECSTVSNEDMLEVLRKTDFDLLVLVGDVFQIRSIRFGNWFSLANQIIPDASIFELMQPYRTNDKNLLKLWESVRKRDESFEEHMQRNRYSKKLDASIFERADDGEDEIILCLNYDGLYGINNINSFLQSRNPHPAFNWASQTYKVGDPVLFNELSLYRPLIYNNLKGTIVKIEDLGFQIEFSIRLHEKTFTQLDASASGLEYVDSSTVKLTVVQRVNNDDDDTEDHKSSVVPFQVAYAISIHKAQGLEYDRVRLVITDSNAEQITHNIFYTAITRTKRDLKVYWSAEVQRRIIDSFKEKPVNKDLSLLRARQLI